MGERVLSYGDVLLRREDVELLEGPHFLNDNIIDFFFAYLSSSSPEGSNPSPLLMVSPSTSFWIMNSPDEQDLERDLEALALPRRQIVLFPINNNDDLNCAGGGSHWSLLVYHRLGKKFLHFDSMGHANEPYARILFSRASKLLGGKAASTRFTNASTPQQENGYDCGVYVMAIAQAIKHGFDKNNTNLIELVSEEVTPESVSKMRQSTLELIQSLSNSSK